MALLQKFTNIEFDIVKNNNDLLLQNFSHSHILISPGPDVPKASGNLLQCIKNNYLHKSILGICLGHQAIAEALGGTLMQLAIPRHGLKTEANIIIESAIFKDVASPMQIGLYHSWAVETQNLPNCLQVTATDSQNVIMALQHKTLPIYGLQFHPESYMCNIGEQLLANWLEI